MNKQWITVTHNYKPYRYQIQQVPTTNSREVWNVIGKNGTLVLSNNRPVLQKHNLKHRLPDWKEDRGMLQNARFLELLYQAIDQAVISGQIKLLPYAQKNK